MQVNMDTSSLPEELQDAYKNAQRIPLTLGIAAFIICVGTGILMLFKPNVMWRIQHFFNTKNGEPTDFYLIITRIAGMIFVIVGIVCLFLTVISQ